MRFLYLTLGWLLLALATFELNAAKIAIVIDDIGYKSSDKRLLDLDAKLTYAVLPHTPLGYQYAKDAVQSNREVIIHLPMQANKNNRLLGPGALTHEMTKQEYQQTLLSALEDIPFAIGVNNHMGSLLTRQEEPMAWTMELLRQHQLFFLDSKTTRHSKIEAVADQYGVDSLARNIFLDHDRNKQAIERQFRRLVRIAKKHGQAIAIGHPYSETREVLEQQLARLSEMNVELVPLSHLLPAPAYLVKSDQPAQTQQAVNTASSVAPQ